MQERIIDLNCDMGESFGAYRLGIDESLLPYITSANIACGFHAGDAAVMRKTVQACKAYNVAIGAHPGLPDLSGFGRRVMQITPDEAYEMVVYQIGALMGFVHSENAELRHVKPHGALYNMAASDKVLAEAIAEAVYRVDSRLILFGLAGSELTQAGIRRGLLVAEEAFADRTYRMDGTLTPRSEDNAVLHDSADAAEQTALMVKDGMVWTSDGGSILIAPDTVCIHGDSPHALEFAMAVRQRLEQEGVVVRAPDLRPFSSR
ncbi:LamB/YcsF family protein [Paenibacillus sp. UNC451MF]|uniref:LamB/YcsF family protein n=1 Tax=Paenibacillus sp. UNC451MF TaxID=1449063 RepID=UPI00048BF785|nr:5-oxoprolinase subunit PxpA [Paenibacillus sp. UNC451MF]